MLFTLPVSGFNVLADQYMSPGGEDSRVCVLAQSPQQCYTLKLYERLSVLDDICTICTIMGEKTISALS